VNPAGRYYTAFKRHSYLSLPLAASGPLYLAWTPPSKRQVRDRTDLLELRNVVRKGKAKSIWEKNIAIENENVLGFREL
jgi:hypothetical protein